jgi:hypothetical protein
MTEDEINQLPAGRGLDKLIAERVMEFELMLDTSLARKGQLTYRRRHPERDWDWAETIVPQYSTHVGATWGGL